MSQPGSSSNPVVYKLCEQTMKRTVLPFRVYLRLFAVGRFFTGPDQSPLHHLTGYVIVTNSATITSSGNTGLSSAGVYVDFAGGSDANSGNSVTNAFKHCPAIPTPRAMPRPRSCGRARTSTSRAHTYTLTGDGNPLYQTGIAIGRARMARLSYICSTNWGTVSA